MLTVNHDTFPKKISRVFEGPWWSQGLKQHLILLILALKKSIIGL